MKTTSILALAAVIALSTSSAAEDLSAKAAGLGKCHQADLAGNWVATIEESFLCSVKVTKKGQIVPLESFENCQAGMTFGAAGNTGTLTLFAMKVTNKCQVNGVYVADYYAPATQTAPEFVTHNDCLFIAGLSVDRSRITGYRQCDHIVNGVTQKIRRAISFAKLP